MKINHHSYLILSILLFLIVLPNLTFSHSYKNFATYQEFVNREKSSIENLPIDWFERGFRVQDGHHRSVFYESVYKNHDTPCYIVFGFDGNFLFFSELFGGVIQGRYSRESLGDTIVRVELKTVITTFYDYGVYASDRLVYVPKQIKYKISGDTLIDITNYNSAWEYINPVPEDLSFVSAGYTADQVDSIFDEAADKAATNPLEGLFRKVTKYVYKYPNPPTPWWNYTKNERVD